MPAPDKKNENGAGRGVDPRADEARRILERVQAESETVGTSSMLRASDRIKAHLGAADADPDNRIEVIGTRIGRTLGLIFFIGIVVFLLNTYVFSR